MYIMDIDKFAHSLSNYTTLGGGCCVEQPCTFPGYLLVNEMNNATHKSNTITEFNFIMPSEQFKKLMEPIFEQRSRKSFLEYFKCDKDGYLMKVHGIWVKIEHEHHKDEEEIVSVKHTVVQNGEVIEYKEVNKSISEAHKYDWFVPVTMLTEIFAVIDVERTEYVHKIDDSVTLTLDIVTFSDDTSFVVMSIKGHRLENTHTDEKIEEIKKYIKPCRSNIMELIWRSDKDLYNLLEEKKHIAKLEYQSMSLAEFENGPEVAQRWEIQANKLKSKLIQENKDLDGKEKHSEQYIQFIYRNTLKFGNDEVENDLDVWE